MSYSLKRDEKDELNVGMTDTNTEVEGVFEEISETDIDYNIEMYEQDDTYFETDEKIEKVHGYVTVPISEEKKTQLEEAKVNDTKYILDEEYLKSISTQQPHIKELEVQKEQEPPKESVDKKEVSYLNTIITMSVALSILTVAVLKIMGVF